MPLGLFGGTSSKAQVLNDTPSRGDKKSLNESNCKGVVLKLSNTTVTILKQLAEGGFAIVYLVSDKKNRKFALKRQFVLDNPKQLEACVRESKIVSSLKGHKNIVEYVDHMISLNKFGQHDCMLMTVYHKRNVLQLMNERISSNQFLQPIEILNIFCDMCEAVARLHHSTTPIIHRDLKVENILIDERNSTHPVFVLCDFGSATTQVLSMSTHSAQEIQEEVERNTTLCYRSPEMIDVYGGQEIGIQSDMWSLGVMLYRLCFFTLPFEESALAIQNGIYLPFPTVPDISMAIKAIIYHLLDVDVNRRPTIYECANLAFEAYGKPNPIDNIHKVPKKSLEAAIAEFNESKPRNQRAPPSPAPKHDQTEAECVEQQSTSVNPRNRPKATQVLPAIPAIPGPQELGFTDLDGVSSHRSRAATDSTQKSTQVHVHRRNASDTSQLSKSAFKPYSQTTQKVARNDEEWNPFLSAPMMDDAHFGEAFDEMRRKEHNTEDDASSIDSRDPFGAAPFDPTATEEMRNRIERFINEAKHTDEDSEHDEQRMKARRRYSYENIDGVGDDASSDSRGRTDRDSDEEDEEADTSQDEEGESSQNTIGSDDGEGGSRPLLEDDGLEEDEEDEILVAASTNPFLRDELTPKEKEIWNWSRRSTITAFAPATLPRQATPLTATPKKPELPQTAPVSIIPSMSSTTIADEPPKAATPPKPMVVAQLIQVKDGSSDEPEDVHICTSEKIGVASGKKKKKKTFGLRSSHPSIASTEMPKSGKKQKKQQPEDASFVNGSFQCEDLN